MANRGGHRRFGNVRKLPSGRYQIRYPGPDGRIRTGPETYERKGEADKALVLIEAQLSSGNWTDPDRGKVKLSAYASKWITERPGLRVRTMDLYRWLLRKHIEPYLGGVPIARLSPQMVREWRATLLNGGVSVSVTAKAYRLLRAIMMTAVEEDKILPSNPCQIRKAGTEDAAERPVLTVTQVFALAEQVGRRPVGNIRAIRLRPRRARRARLPGRQRWSDQAGQLQQDVGLAARRRVHRHARAALPRPPAHGEPVRGTERRRAPRPDGPHGPRQRASRVDLPARGPRRRPAHHERYRRPRPGRARQGRWRRERLSGDPGPRRLMAR